LDEKKIEIESKRDGIMMAMKTILNVEGKEVKIPIKKLDMKFIRFLYGKNHMNIL
jgi:hypothetical protein